jgi:excinuclease ABC subunit B
VVVATVSAIYGIGDPSEYHCMILLLRQGDRMGQRDAIKRLTELQYQRNDTEFRRGTFRVHGDVIDIFPAEHAENAIRVSLFDDEVESLQLFDPLTGHIKQKLPRCTVFPSSHYVTGRHTVLDAIEAIKVELAEQKQFFVSQMKLVRPSASSSAALRPGDDARDRPQGSRTTRHLWAASRASRRRR